MQNSPRRQVSSQQATIFVFRPTITERHHAHLLRWLHAGRRMGLHDGQVTVTSRPGEPRVLQAVIWVRENADPAYTVTPGRANWTVSDCVRNQRLGEFRTFEAALDFIRPVLGLEDAA